MHLLIYLLNDTVNEWDLWKSLCCISSQTFSPGCPRFPAWPGSPIFPSQPGNPLPPVSPLSPTKRIIWQYKCYIYHLILQRGICMDVVMDFCTIVG